MTNLEIKIRLEQILAKIQENTINAWNDDLESTFDCVVLEDGRDITYNGWINELEALHDDIIA